MSAIVVTYDDVFDILATAIGATPEGYYRNHTPLALSAVAYTKVKIRYKISGAGAKAHLRIRYSGGSTTDILAAGTSATWTVVTVTPTTGLGTIDYIEVGVIDATGHLYVDFALVYKDDFSLPNTKYGQVMHAPGRYGVNETIGALGDEIQNLGNKSAILDLSCDLDIGTWTRAGDVMNGQVFLDIIHNSPSEPFQWLDTGDMVCQFKVQLDTPEFQNEVSESEANHRLHLVLHEFRRSPANGETVIERFGLNI